MPAPGEVDGEHGEQCALAAPHDTYEVEQPLKRDAITGKESIRANALHVDTPDEVAPGLVCRRRTRQGVSVHPIGFGPQIVEADDDR